MASLDLASEVKKKLLISSVIKKTVELRGSGTRFLALCPFHQEKTPSFHIRDDVGRFKCFGCGASGDAINFLMRLRGLGFKEAVLELADEAGIVRSSSQSPTAKVSKPQKDFIEANKVAHSFFMGQLRHERLGLEARRYLIDERKLTGPMIEQAGIGFGGAHRDDFIAYLRQKNISTECAIAAGLLKQGPFSVIAPFLGRIIFPIRAADGRIIAFGGRSFLASASDTPKYVNTQGNELYEKKKAFYGLFESRAAIEKGQTPCLVEGYFDAMAMWAAGIPALALCGTALSAEHVRLLKRLSSRLLIAFDKDAAGLKALKASLSLLFAEQIQVNVIELARKDPGDYLQEQALPELASAAANASDALCYAIDEAALLGNADITHRIAQIDELMPILQSIARPLIRRQYVVYLANKLHEDPSLLWMEIEKRRRTNVQKQKKEGIKAPQSESIEGLSAHERLLAPIFLAHPTLLEQAPLLADLVSAEFLNFFKDPDIEQAWGRLIVQAGEEGVALTQEEAQAVITGLIEQDKRRKTKALLTSKRQNLQQAEKKKDFSLILHWLKEHSEALAAQKPKKEPRLPAILPKEPKALVQERKVYIKKDEAILGDTEEEGWY